MTCTDALFSAIREFVKVPPHIQACAGAIRYDLLWGPSFSRIPPEGIEHFTADDLSTFYSDLEDDPGEITETYCGPVADALKGFIADLPTLYYEEWSGYVYESEPQPYEDYDHDEWTEPEYYVLDRQTVVEALFGKTIAREFR